MLKRTILIWIRAVRLPFLTATLVPVVLGTAVAWQHTGSFHAGFFVLVLTGIACLHIGTNLANDYYDHLSRNDELNKTPTPFSGGSRVIQDGLVPAGTILAVSLSFFGAGSLIGLYLAYARSSIFIVLLGGIGVFLGLFYTAKPLKIGYLGCGEIIVGLCFGPLVVMGSYYIQAVEFSFMPLWASIPVGILIALVLYINEFPDYEADRQVNKKTLVVMLGKEKAVKIFHGLMVILYVYALTGALFGVLPGYTLIILLTVPLAIKAYRVSAKHYQTVGELLPANAATIGLHLTFGLLLSAGYVLDKVF